MAGRRTCEMGDGERERGFIVEDVEHVEREELLHGLLEVGGVVHEEFT